MADHFARILQQMGAAPRDFLLQTYFTLCRNLVQDRVKLELGSYLTLYVILLYSVHIVLFFLSVEEVDAYAIPRSSFKIVDID